MDKQTITRPAVMRVLKDYFKQYSNHPFQIAIAFLLPAIASILVSFVPPLVIARLVNILAEKNEFSLQSVGGYIAIFGGLWLLGEIFQRIGMHFLIKLETIGINNLGKSAFKELSNRDYDFYTSNFVGTLTKKAYAFSRGFEIFTDTLSFNVLTNILPIIFAVIVLWRYSPWIPLVLLFFIAVAITFGIPIVRRRSHLVTERHDASSKATGRMSDALTNMLAVKSFAKEKNEQDAFGELFDDYTLKFKKTADYQNLRFDILMSPMYVITNSVGLISAVFFTHLLGLEAGVMVIVFSYYAQITRIFWDINRVYRNIESSVSEAAEFTQLMINPPLVQDVSGATILSISNANIIFQDVDFGYDDNIEKKEKNLFLKDFNLNIKSQERIGLVGPSGGGKTTITKLLLRFIDLQSGKITIDGQDINRVTQTSLRNSIAYVPQESLLFHRSVFHNIAYGNDHATESEVIAAAKLARAHEFIEKLPYGYETLVGERGIKLSGGQRQRIAIARALLKSAPILVLDEATSSLDSESEKYIQEGLWELMKNKTALVIAHRLSTIKHLDRIIVLDDGKIVQDGTHEELIKQKGLYAKLWSHQSGDLLKD